VNVEELLAEAAALDGQAAMVHREGISSGALRLQAAELRLQAIGPKPYPVLICATCSRLTGWVGANGDCAHELRRRQLPGGGWVKLEDHRPPLPTDGGPLLRRWKRSLGIGSARDRSRAWLDRVDPGETGPIEPEEGWELELPIKHEERAPEGPDLLVCFDVASFRFEYGAWRPAEKTRGGKPPRLMPREFAASLPVVALAEAWNDFGAEVTAHNRRVWQAEAARRHGVWQAEKARHDAEELQRGTSDALG
jgi:hypothetical protein